MAVGSVVGLAFFFGLYFGLPPRKVEVIPSVAPTTIPSSTAPPYSKLFSAAAVATDAGPCSTIGKDILLQGGSVVDSAIASMLCIGIYNPHRFVQQKTAKYTKNL